MTTSPSKKRIIKPPLDRFGGVRVVQRRIRKSEVIEHNKDNVAQELIDIATANIDEIMDWDAEGNVSIRDPKNISKSAIKAIKKIKVTPTKMGPQLEVELHDKVGVLRVLAKASGLLEQEQDADRPSVVQINMSGPEEPKIVEAEDDEINNAQGSREDPSSDVKETTE
jgi:hypothetical protein|tara:strand:+ start:58 stop:561 length:504 start_codon:yes stop_codon:yes gene_type:complete